MAVIDPSNDTVVIRIVYDGPPMAGKTTSVRALARHCGGDVVVSDEIAGRTLYFDWLDYTGGLFEGRRIRCQIVSVPGQAALAARRARLLESADVVVFVADSSSAELATLAGRMRELRVRLAALPGPPIGIVLQANKRDMPDAVPLDAMRATLGETEGQLSIVESVAAAGSGIREAFVLSVRLALDRVRELMANGQLQVMRPDIDNASDLLADLQRMEGDAVAERKTNEAVDSTLAAQALHEVFDERQRAQVRAEGASPTLPNSRLPSGLIWPPVQGRMILQAITDAAIDLACDADGNWSGTTSSGWRVHSPADARFHGIERAQAALVAWARLHAASASVISGNRCLALGDDDGVHFRLWQCVRIEPSLHDDLHAALAQGGIAQALIAVKQACQQGASRFAGTLHPSLPGLRELGATAAGIRHVGPMPGPQEWRDRVLPSQQALQQRLLDELAAWQSLHAG